MIRIDPDGVTRLGPPVADARPLVVFLYQLLRDEIPASRVEAILVDLERAAGKTCTFSNGYLAVYAIDIAERLTVLTEEDE